MESRLVLFILQIILVYCNAQQLEVGSSPFLAGKNTPVWFLESNPNDSENPILHEIPGAIEKAGLIDAVDELSGKSNITIKKNTLYLEILVAADYALYNFWTSVDLRFRPLASPRIYINIAGIVIAKDQKALYYVENNKDDLGKVNGNKVLLESGKYFKNKTETANHDILVTLTGEDICVMDKTNVCDAYTVGASLVGKACDSQLSTAVIEDNGAFSGVLIAAHEIGHLLRIPHDGVGSASYCMTHESYIMAVSLYEYNDNNFKWSYCSKEVFHDLPSKPLSECLKNKPEPSTPVKFILPGQVLSANQQCERNGYGNACDNPRRMCNRLLCLDKEAKECKNLEITAEGTTCGDNMYCLAGECVAEQ